MSESKQLTVIISGDVKNEKGGTTIAVASENVTITFESSEQCGNSEMFTMIRQFPENCEEWIAAAIKEMQKLSEEKNK